MSTALEGATSRDGLDSAAGWRVVAAATFGMALGPSAIIMLSFGVLANVLHTEFGWDQSRIPLGVSFAAIGLAFVSPLQGWLVDHFGPRKVILYTLPFWAAFLFLIALLPPSFPLFLFLCALMPFAALGLWPLSFLTMPAGWFERRLGLAIGITNFGVGAGAALIPILLGVGIAHVGWRWSYAGIGIFILLVVTPVLSIFLKEGGVATGKGAALVEGAPAIAGWSFFRHPRFQLLATTFFLLGLTGSSLLAFLIPILVDRGMAQDKVIFAQSTLGIGTIFGRIFAGWLLDHFAVRAVGLGIFTLAAASAIALAVVGAGPIALGAALLLGLVVGAEFDLLAVAVRRFFGLGSFGRMYGAAFAIFQFGAAIGIGLLGLVKESFGSYAISLWIFAAILFASGLFFTRIGSRDDEIKMA